MRLLISFAALFLSIAFLQLSSGAMGSLDALSGLAEDFSQTQIGLLGSAHFLGFFIGCWWVPRLMGAIGHSRAFAVFSAFGAIGAIAHPMLIDPWAWALMRVMTGLCVAGCFTVVESWLQSKLTNANRGRVMGFYRVVDIGAASVAQFMIGFLEPAAFVSYNLLAILCCASLLPLALTQARQPTVPEAPRLHPIRTAIVSPLAAAGVLVAGVTTAAFRMVAPVYGAAVGLSPSEIGSFLAVVLIGGAAGQFPAGWLADTYDRRWVLIGLSALSVMICAGLAAAGGAGDTLLFVMAFAFGLTTFPIFSVSAAHANDFATPGEIIEINASLVFIYAIGAVFAPFLGAMLIAVYGPGALFTLIAAAHVGLLMFGFARMAVRPTRARTRYRYLPRTSFTIARLLRRRREE
ncbi:MAG: MFS transporter [Pseudomonadota bacterium]